MLNRLPLPDLDPSTLAQLAAGVSSHGVDSLTGRINFSVAGMSDLLNQVTLDGAIMGEGGMGVPDEGVRQTQVTTSTFDVSRGGFAGGQVSMSTARGNNRAAARLLPARRRRAAVAHGADANAFTRHNLGGSWGGPIVTTGSSTTCRSSCSRTRTIASRWPRTIRGGTQRSGVSRLDRALPLISDGGFGLPTPADRRRTTSSTGRRAAAGPSRLEHHAAANASHTLSCAVQLNLNGRTARASARSISRTTAATSSATTAWSARPCVAARRRTGRTR
jgi:hypothetical protein